MFFPDAVQAAVSIHGTGFQSDLWLGNIAVIAFVVWCFRSGGGGKKALAMALIPAALLTMAVDATAAPGFPDYGVVSPYDHPIQRMPFDGAGVTPVVIFGVLVWVLSGAKAEKPKPKKPAAKKPDAADLLASILRDGKKLVPLALLAIPVDVYAAGSPPPKPDGLVIGWTLIGGFALLALFKALACRRYLLASILSIFVFLGAAGAMTNARADFWESDGERAIREAEAERIRLEAQARYRRELALLQSKGYAPAPADEGPAVAFWIAFGVSCAAVAWGFVESRWRTARESEIRNLKQRLEIAERRPVPALPPYPTRNFWEGVDR